MKTTEESFTAPVKATRESRADKLARFMAGKGINSAQVYFNGQAATQELLIGFFAVERICMIEAVEAVEASKGVEAVEAVEAEYYLPENDRNTLLYLLLSQGADKTHAIASIQKIRSIVLLSAYR